MISNEYNMWEEMRRCSFFTYILYLRIKEMLFWFIHFKDLYSKPFVGGIKEVGTPYYSNTLGLVRRLQQLLNEKKCMNYCGYRTLCRILPEDLVPAHVSPRGSGNIVPAPIKVTGQSMPGVAAWSEYPGAISPLSSAPESIAGSATPRDSVLAARVVGRPIRRC